MKTYIAMFAREETWKKKCQSKATGEKLLHAVLVHGKILFLGVFFSINQSVFFPKKPLQILPRAFTDSLHLPFVSKLR